MDSFSAQSYLAQNILNGIPPYQRDYARCRSRFDIDKLINEDDVLMIIKKGQEELKYYRKRFW